MVSGNVEIDGNCGTTVSSGSTLSGGATAIYTDAAIAISDGSLLTLSGSLDINGPPSLTVSGGSTLTSSGLTASTNTTTISITNGCTFTSTADVIVSPSNGLSLSDGSTLSVVGNNLNVTSARSAFPIFFCSFGFFVTFLITLFWGNFCSGLDLTDGATVYAGSINLFGTSTNGMNLANGGRFIVSSNVLSSGSGPLSFVSTTSTVGGTFTASGDSTTTFGESSTLTVTGSASFSRLSMAVAGVSLTVGGGLALTDPSANTIVSGSGTTLSVGETIDIQGTGSLTGSSGAVVNANILQFSPPEEETSGGLHLNGPGTFFNITESVTIPNSGNFAAEFLSTLTTKTLTVDGLSDVSGGATITVFGFDGDNQDSVVGPCLYIHDGGHFTSTTPDESYGETPGITCHGSTLHVKDNASSLLVAEGSRITMTDPDYGVLVESSGTITADIMDASSLSIDSSTVSITKFAPNNEHFSAPSVTINGVDSSFTGNIDVEANFKTRFV